MPRNYKKPLGSRAYKNYTEDTLEKALLEVKQGKLSLRKAAEKYNIHRNTLWSKLKGKHDSSVGRPLSLSIEEERCMAAHLIAVSSFGFPMTSFDLRLVVKAYLNRQGKNVPAFSGNMPGKDWIRSFLMRHKKYLSERLARNISHKRAATNEEVLNEFFEHFRKESEGVPPSNMWNYDESNLVDDPGSSRVITRRGCKYPEKIRNSTKACTSIMFCCNASGGYAPIYVNYKADHIWSTWTENGPNGARYNRTQSGWFDFVVFEDWFTNLMLPILKKQDGRKILIGDNLSSHINLNVIRLCEEHNISFVALPPNATHLLQPLDVSVFRPMKEAWRQVLGQWKSEAAGIRCSTVPKDTFPTLLNKLMTKLQPNLLSNIKAGFAKTGLFPYNPAKALDRLPNRVLEDASKLSELSGLISETFVQQLESKRTEATQPLRKKRKRINITPGKSVSAAEVEAQIVTTKTHEAKAQQKKRKKVGLDETRNPYANPQPGPSGTSQKSGKSDNKRKLVECAEESQESDPELDSLLNKPSCSPKQSVPLGGAKNFSVGDFVVVSYNGELYPGQITVINSKPDMFRVSTMARKGRQWIWPKRIDEIDYSLEEILFKIEEPAQISRREIYNVPELEKMLNL